MRIKIDPNSLIAKGVFKMRVGVDEDQVTNFVPDSIEFRNSIAKSTPLS